MGVPVVVHCCAPDAPVALFREAGAVAVSLDLDPAAAASTRWARRWTPASACSPGWYPPSGRPSDQAAADTVLDLWGKLGFPLRDAPAQVVVTPACGLAGASPALARAATTAAREAARRLLDTALG